jgi:hypothetical protein
MPREFWPPWFPVDEWFPQAAPYIEIAIDYLGLWLLLLVLPFIAWDLLARRGKACRQSFDRFADQAARPVRGRHLIGLAAFGIIAARLDEDPWVAIPVAAALLWLAIALANRHETLEYFRKRGIDPYNKKQVQEHMEKVHRELREEGIIPPGD